MQDQKSYITNDVATVGLNILKSKNFVSEDGNKFISPLSAYIVLTMLQQGASGETEKELSAFLSGEKLTPSELSQRLSHDMNILQNEMKDVVFDLQSSLWLEKSYRLKTSFAEKMQRDYHAPVTSVSFAEAEKTADAINLWVKEATRDLISKVVEPKGLASMRMLMANATYFKGEWTSPFQMLEEREFQMDERNVYKRSFMVRASSHHYLSEDDFEIIAKPFGKDQSVSMVFIKSKKSIQDFLSAQTLETWNKLIGSLFQSTPRYGTLSMPNLILDMEVDLKKVISEGLGVRSLFDPDKADLSHIIEREKSLPPSEIAEEEPLYLELLKQITHLKVDMNGAEAAAVTVAGIVGGGMPPQSQYEMVLDRPYMIALIHHKTAMPLFMGVIFKP